MSKNVMRTCVCGAFGDDLYFIPMDAALDVKAHMKFMGQLPWPQQKMLAWLPKEFIERFGEKSSGMDGDCLLLPVTDKKAMVAYLRDAGHKVILSDAVIKGGLG